ncbi:squalene epoxidase-domain-containing protein [Limtongia smithiae]|uniref:squalene epoxidase-domain-containing protein n=1 Tax=Limtongia smithiae TaxID=1125753 RepID=UPI0034CFDA7C
MANSTADKYDVVIVGAGVVGASLAATLGKQGRSVLVIERDWSEPDRIVGELLQPGGVLALTKLGLRDCLEGIDAVPVYGYDVFYESQDVKLPYTPDPKHPEKSLEGHSFHHGRFIQKLRDAAKAAPNVTTLEATVNDLIIDKETGRVFGVRCTSKDSENALLFSGSLIVVADGTFSKFRREFVSTVVQIRSHFVGIILQDADVPAPNHGHVILGQDHAPILVYQIGTHETRMLVDVQGKLPSAGNGDLKRHLSEVVSKSIPQRLLPSFTKAIESDRLRSMPNSYLPPSDNNVPGVILLGDAYNMRHPLTGGGMTVAFNDVYLVSEILSPANVPDLDNVDLVVAQLNDFYWKRKALSSVVNILAQALYSLFAANDASLVLLQRGCFRYFQRGGACVAEPIGLLSGVKPVPFLLIYHFFSVAFYAVFCMFKDASPPQYPVVFINSFAVIYKACVVVLPVLYSESR